jgi:hypothetical protein
MGDNLQEDCVVDDGIEDSSAVSLIQLEEETVERVILALDTQKGPGARRDISTDSKKKRLCLVLF